MQHLPCSCIGAGVYPGDFWCPPRPLQDSLNCRERQFSQPGCTQECWQVSRRSEAGQRHPKPAQHPSAQANRPGKASHLSSLLLHLLSIYNRLEKMLPLQPSIQTSLPEQDTLPGLGRTQHLGTKGQSSTNTSFAEVPWKVSVGDLWAHLMNDTLINGCCLKISSP